LLAALLRGSEDLAVVTNFERAVSGVSTDPLGRVPFSRWLLKDQAING
jgi:hypothetical protein